MRYILSAGRTGTVFFERLITEQFGTGAAKHEPASTRYQMMLANFRNDTGLGKKLLKRVFENSRASRIGQRPDALYVEINPFLCALTDLIPSPANPLRVVHMVREPADWAASMTTFRASSKFRHVIDFIPFAKPYPSPRPDGWARMDELERALWRWKWCNSRIGALEAHCEAYALLRYEDIFSTTFEVAERSIGLMSETLGLPKPLSIAPSQLQVRANPSTGRIAKPSRETTARVCGDLAQKYGYYV